MPEITVEALRNLEASLTPEQQRFALDTLRDAGWPVDDPHGVPLWVWQQAFACAKILPTPTK